MASIIHLADVTIGPLVLRILFSHAALNEEDGGYNDDENTGNDTDGDHNVSPGPDVVEGDKALAARWGDIWQRLPGRHT